MLHIQARQQQISLCNMYVQYVVAVPRATATYCSSLHCSTLPIIGFAANLPWGVQLFPKIFYLPPGQVNSHFHMSTPAHTPIWQAGQALIASLEGVTQAGVLGLGSDRNFLWEEELRLEGKIYWVLWKRNSGYIDNFYGHKHTPIYMYVKEGLLYCLPCSIWNIQFSLPEIANWIWVTKPIKSKPISSLSCLPCLMSTVKSYSFWLKNLLD